jgi:signal transduction histidine kinase
VRRGWSVRARATAAAVLVLVPVLAAAGGAGIRVQRDDLTAGVETLAEDRARTLAADLPDQATPAEVAGEEEVVQIVSATTGAVLVAPPEAGAEPLLPAPATTQPVHHLISGGVGGEPDRYAAVAVLADDGSTYVVVARSLESVDAAAASTTEILLVGGLLVLVTAAGLVWLATGRALSPVEVMRRRAASLSADDLTARLPVPAGRDEVARLASTLNELLDRVEESTRSRRRFVADASHELRSPVATIRALLESDRVAAHPGGPAGLSAEVLEETARLAALIDDLLLLARGDASRPRDHGPVDLTRLVTSETRRARTVPVETDVEAGLRVVGDPTLLRAVVRNLLDNAERFATAGVVVAAHHQGAEVLVEVVDDGPGVPPADRDRIFERFVRLDDSRSRAAGGTGLGLAIVRQVVSDHGGTVTVGPAATAGARFVVRLPVASPACTGRAQP